MLDTSTEYKHQIFSGDEILAQLQSIQLPGKKFARYVGVEESG